MKHKIQTLIKAIYPSLCVGCGEMVESDFGLCGRCWRETPFIDGVVCDACGAPLVGEHEGGVVYCDSCIEQPRPWTAGRAAMMYQNNARRLVLPLKHGDRLDLVRPAAKWMARAAKPLVRPNMIVVPVPLHWTRLFRRKFNQASMLADSVARELDLAWCPDVLVRPKQMGSMKGLSQKDRFSKMSGAIETHPKRRHKLAARPVLLVDDVMASGATLAAATNACLSARAQEVHILVLARVAKDA
ncbi:ComF family protein [Shimia litoralis]|uniref:ComF family protein n=1 Tax=Shimia litoralis TaxID=420403 RepID=A0A4U7MTE6_9RHOB|nr:ComF family protein [Shimia litoralis]TKZ15977.1 ComF family protein [Shimia litoralis]